MIIAKYYEYKVSDVMKYFSDAFQTDAGAIPPNQDTVMRYFASGFNLKEGFIAADIPPDWFVDTGRGVVVFKLFIDDGTEPPEGEPPDVPTA